MALTGTTTTTAVFAEGGQFTFVLPPSFFTGAAGQLTYSIVGGDPSGVTGLTVDPITGILTGTLSSGSSTVDITATDGVTSITSTINVSAGTISNIYHIEGDNIEGDFISVGTKASKAAFLYGLGGNDTLTSGANNDQLYGGVGNDSLVSNVGNDILDGGAGIDTLIGGAGDDVYFVDSLTDVVTETTLAGSGTDTIISSVTIAALAANVENLSLTGTGNLNGTGNILANTISGNAVNNSLDGGSANDTLIGGDGNDTLNGGIGIDSLVGGIGNDLYIVDATTDVVTDLVGVDSVQSSATYTLSTGLDNLTLTGTAINGTGNTGANFITGNAGNNSLDGGSANDTLIGGDGNDTLIGGTGIDSLVGGGGNDLYIVDTTIDLISDSVGVDSVQSSVDYILSAGLDNLTLTGTALNGTGNADANFITGNAENNTLDSGTDALIDTLIGGAGNDLYLVNTTSDIVTEDLSAGTADTVQSSVTYTLGANIENLTLTGTAAINGTGNTGANFITGNTGNNSLSGSDGNDTLIGSDGNDTLNGGIGIDSLVGGNGNDLYIVDATTDVISDSVGIDSVQSSATYALSTGLDNLTLTGIAAINGTGNADANFITGNTGNNSLDGGAANDTLIGSDGNDTLIGGTGIDSLVGGNGNDLYIVDATTDVISDSLGIDLVESSATYTLSTGLDNLTLTGVADINGTGNADANKIIGNTGDNTLSSGTDGLIDTLIGGAGNDLYLVNTTSDIVTENVSEGTADTVQSSVTYTLSANIENLTLTGTAAINGTGNTGANFITGNTGNNSLSGSDGNDTLIGSDGNDTLNGGTGIDSLVGGNGNDLYIVDSTADVISDSVGVDSVQSSATYTLSAGLDNLTLTGTTSINGTGNDDANTITGNTGNNSLDGGVGNDTLIGGDGNDTLIGGTGNDSLFGGNGNDLYIVDAEDPAITDAAGIDTVQSLVNYTLSASLENLELLGTDNINGTGNALANKITGNIGDNTLNAGTDALIDTLIGGLGNDLYIVGTTTDIVTENLSAGTADMVESSVTYTLSANIENLTLTGIAAINGTGNTGANFITGNIGNNSLSGSDGNDTLIGGDGNDTLNGGTGIDSLVGGDGNTFYIVDVTNDIISDSAGTADTVQSSATYTLNADLENLTLTGITDINAIGNDSANILTGNTGNNSLIGDAGNDTLIGGDGADTLNGGEGTDSLAGGAGNDLYIIDAGDLVITDTSGIDTVQSGATYILAASLENLELTGIASIGGTGNALANKITGNIGNNTLNAGTDALIDTLIGGLGNDTYVVGTTTDIVTELSGEGTDLVQSTVNYTIGTNVENLTLTGTTAINGTGNTAPNVITGNTGNNTLEGGDGNDTLNGSDGNDTLNGGVGNDNLNGGIGNDFYIIDATPDVIADTSGIDTALSSITNTIASFTTIENLTLTGSDNINGTGNTGLNVITGNTGNNTLDGGIGNDTLIGGVGADTLIGGTGNDFLTGGTGADTLSGETGLDRFDYRTLTDSLLANPDTITLLNTDEDLFFVTTARTAFNNVGVVSTFNQAGIAAAGKLDATIFTANSVGQFSFGADSYIAINDGVAGFSETTDAIIKVTGSTGTGFSLADFTTI